jgi:F-BAR domain only protein
MRTENNAIRINNFASLDAIGPNHAFVHGVADRPGEYTLDPAHIHPSGPYPSKAPAVGFAYKVHTADESGKELLPQLPLLLKVDYAKQGDRLGIKIAYSLNPEFAGLDAKDGKLALSGVTIGAYYGGARSASAQTKPPGTHIRDRQVVMWRLGDVSLAKGEWHKIICRVGPPTEAGELAAGRVEARWEYQVPAAKLAASGDGDDGAAGLSISRLVEGKGKGKAKADDKEEVADPFADETPKAEDQGKDGKKEVEEDKRWVEVALAKKVVSGKYEAK